MRLGFLIILFSIILVGITPVLAHNGDHEEPRKMKLGMDWLWPEKPVFCIFEPKGTMEKSFAAFYDVVEMVKYSGDYWAYAMEKFGYDKEDWEVDFVVYQDYEYSDKVFKEYPNCDVYVHFELGEADSTLGGWVKVAKGVRVFDEMVIILSHYSEPDSLVDAVKHQSKERHVVQQTVTHEFGHALQIGHYTPEMKLSDGTHFDMMAESMMFGQVNGELKYRSITDRDVQALVRMYGDDGFGGNIMPFTRFLDFSMPDDRYVVWHEQLKTKMELKEAELKKKGE